MRMNSNIYNSLWFDNGRQHTLMSLIFIAIALGCLVFGDVTAGMFALVIAELNRVDKDIRILGIDQTEVILYEGDHPDESKDDDHE